MGEIAEMMLDGILDANGEYTGHNYGYPVYPKGWFNKEKVPVFNKVMGFLKSKQVSFDDRLIMIKEYGKVINYKSDKPGKICKGICKNSNSWKAFKKYIENKLT